MGHWPIFYFADGNGVGPPILSELLRLVSDVMKRGLTPFPDEQRGINRVAGADCQRIGL